MAAEKIPVGGSLAHAYTFTFGNFVNNVGAIWIPLGLSWLAPYLLQMVSPHEAGMMISRGESLAIALLYILFGMLLGSAQIAGLSKEALGLRVGNSFLQNPFGAGAWRALANYLLFLLVMVVIYFAITLLVILLGDVFGLRGGNSNLSFTQMRALNALLGLVALCVIIYLGTRLWFFIAPVSVGDRQVSLIRTWELSKGNFWRIFIILFVLYIPFVILDGFLLYKLAAPIFNALHPGMTPEEMAAAEQQVAANIRGLMENWWFLGYPLAFLHTLLTSAFYAGASAYAFRAVTHSDNTAEVF